MAYLEILDVNSGQKGTLVSCAKNKHENGKILLIKGLGDAGGEIIIEATIDVGEEPIFEPMDFDGETAIAADGHYTLPAMNYRIRAVYSGTDEAGENIELRLQ
jgi:hypothetical protein